MNHRVKPQPTVMTGRWIRHGRIGAVGAATVFFLVCAVMLMTGTVAAQDEDAPARRARGGAEPGIDFKPNEKPGRKAAPRRRRSATKSGDMSKGRAGKGTTKGTQVGTGKAERVRLIYVGKKKPSDPIATAKDKTSDDCEVKGITPGMICIGDRIGGAGGGGGGGGMTSGDPGAEQKLLTARLNVFVTPKLFSADREATYKITLDVGAPNMNVPRDLVSRGQALSDIATVMRRLRRWERTLNAKETKKIKLKRSFTFRLVKPFQGLKKMKLVDPVRLTVRLPNVRLSDITSH